ncbi:MAG: hypothetical protein ACREXX_22340 [Gammaproteobacteria bacterium]
MLAAAVLAGPVLPFEFLVRGYRALPSRPEDSLLIVLGMYETSPKAALIRTDGHGPGGRHAGASDGVSDAR